MRIIDSSLLGSKSFYTGIALIITGVGMIKMGEVTEGIQTIAGGLITIFVRDAIAKTAKK